jgi:hypothetical protein
MLKKVLINIVATLISILLLALIIINSDSLKIKIIDFLDIPHKLEFILEEVDMQTIRKKLDSKYVTFPYFNLANLHYKENIDYSAEVFKNHDYIVIGEPVTLEMHHKEQKVVADSIKDKTRIFGYVEAGSWKDKPPRDMELIKQEIDNIAAENWYGVFFDQFGYDFNETRERQNIMIKYAHEKGLVCFPNAWFVSNVFYNEVHKEHNPKGLPDELKEGDWYLLESFYTSNGGYREEFQKYLDASEISFKRGIKMATLTYKRDDVLWEEALAEGGDVERAYILNLTLGFDGWSFIDEITSKDFEHAKIPFLDLGTELIQPLKLEKGNIYTAKTDKYTIKLDMTNYPLFEYKIYKEVPEIR